MVEACGSYWSKDVLAKSVVKDLRNRRSLTSSQAVAIVGMRKPLTNWKGHLTCPFLIRFVYLYIYVYICTVCIYVYTLHSFPSTQHPAYQLWAAFSVHIRHIHI